DLLAAAEYRQHLRLEVHTDPGWSGRHAPLVPAIIAILHATWDIKDRLHRPVDRSRGISLAERFIRHWNAVDWRRHRLRSGGFRLSGVPRAPPRRRGRRAQ